MSIEVALGSMTSWIVFIGIAVGQASRTLLPYWDKLKSGEIEFFDKKFLGTAIISFIGAVIPSLALFPAVLEQLDPVMANVGLAAVFVLSILVGYGANDIVNYGLKLSTRNASNAALEKKIDVIVEEKISSKLAAIELKGEAVGTELPKDTIGGSDSVTQPT